MQGLRFTDHLFFPLEPIKDASAFRLRPLLLVMVVGHPFFYWVWTQVYPEPYESLPLRLACAALSLVAYVLARLHTERSVITESAYVLTGLIGTVFAGSWLYFANGGDSIWLASLCVMTMLYFTITDWRIALATTLLALALAWWIVTFFQLGLWARAPSPANAYVIGFTVVMASLTRLVDMNWRMLRMRSQFQALGLVAHELRTPLAGLSLLGAALEDRLNDAAERPRLNKSEWREIGALAHEIVRQTHAANTLISTQLANANPFRPFATREPVDLAETVRNAVDLFTRATAVPAGVVDVQLEATPIVRGDGLMLRQVVINLLSNALVAVTKRHKHPPAGSIVVAISEASGTARLLVSDAGIGIDKIEMSRIFKPFYTGSPEFGHGLGLTFVEAAVKAYLGKIDVQSTKDVGTRFTITLPCTPSNHASTDLVAQAGRLP